jgi:hypothetical protein
MEEYSKQISEREWEQGMRALDSVYATSYELPEEYENNK